jgi:integrase
VVTRRRGRRAGAAVRDVRTILRSALSHALTEQLVARNVAALVKLPAMRKRTGKAWSSDEARRFLESAHADRDPVFAAYVLVLVLGLRKGEVLGLAWDDIDLERNELTVGLQLQRVGRQLLHRETKTEASDATLPLPDICVTALRLRQASVQTDSNIAGPRWHDSNLVFTTRYGTPIDPCNLPVMGHPLRQGQSPKDHRARRAPNLR